MSHYETTAGGPVVGLFTITGDLRNAGDGAGELQSLDSVMTAYRAWRGTTKTPVDGIFHSTHQTHWTDPPVGERQDALLTEPGWKFEGSHGEHLHWAHRLSPEAFFDLLASLGTFIAEALSLTAVTVTYNGRWEYIQRITN